MYIHIKARWFDFFAATKCRYYDISHDDFIEPKPGIRLFLAPGSHRWVISNEGFRNLRKTAETKVG